MSILAIDVHYHDDTAQAVAAGVLFDSWQCTVIEKDYVLLVDQVAPYQSGEFFRRELPCILQLIEQHQLKPDVIVVDGHVYLDANQRRGLGWYVHDALGIPVVGVAKQAFHDSAPASAILRGRSDKPLYVTAIGMDQEEAKSAVANMKGNHRLPTLLKQVDALCRETHKALFA